MKTLIIKGWRPTSVLLLLFIIWEFFVKIFNIEQWLLPSPSHIFIELVHGTDVYLEHLWPTIQLCIIGLLLGCAIGIVTGTILHIVSFLREAFYPLLIISQNIPIIVLAPLLVIWFGFGMLPKIIVIILVCFFPITIALLDGFKQIDRDIMNYMKMAGATKKQIFWKLEWPNALPSLFSGIKISATYSVMGAVISEWLGASKGIGVYMQLSQSSFRTDRVFVAIIFIILISLLLLGAIMMFEKWMIRWRPREENNRE
jgi:ABC-type nitrate/sulfonate/bicarbonate transport system permease component